MKLNSKTLLFIIPFFIISAQCSDVVIRPATENDLPVICNLDRNEYEFFFMPLWKKYYSSLTPPHQTIDEFVTEKKTNNNDAIKDFIKKQANKEEYGLLVAANKESIVGYCRFKKTDLTTIYINNILVDKSYRQKGIAKKLVTAAFGKWNGIRTCNFRALIHYEFINNIYQKYDYEQRDEVSLDPTTGGIKTDPSAPKTHYEYTYAITKKSNNSQKTSLAFSNHTC